MNNKLIHLSILCIFSFSMQGAAIVEEQARIEATIFNVGQGSCVLVKHPHEGALLVDAGSTEWEHLGTDFKRSQIENIVNQLNDQVRLTIVVSHADIDHYGWIPEIVDRLPKHIRIKLILGGNAQDYETKPGNDTPLKKLLRLNERCHTTFASDMREVDLQAFLPQFTVPLSAMTTGGATQKNTRSIVLKVPEISMLIPGDATGKTTDRILSNPEFLKYVASQIFIASHHGATSEDANNEAFLRAALVRYLIVSAGKQNKHNHPNAEFVERCLKYLNARQETTKPHFFTFYQEDRKMRDPRMRPTITYDDGRCLAITDFPCYTTADMGNITAICNKKQIRLLFQHKEAQGLTFEDSTLSAVMVNRANWAVTSIDLSHSSFTDDQLKVITTLPPQLKLLDLNDNKKLSNRGIMRLINLFRHNPQNKFFQIYLHNTGFTCDNLHKLEIRRLWQLIAICEDKCDLVEEMSARVRRNRR